MTISNEDVKHVAKLARIAMTDEQLSQMTVELDMIIESIGKISELDLEGVEPTTHALEVVNVLAEDKPHESLSREDALRSAPDPVDGCFRVPRMQS